MGIRVGVCCDISSIAVAERTGYAYLECVFESNHEADIKRAREIMKVFEN